MSRSLIVGCGYTGARLGERLIASGHEVFGTSRSEVRGSELAARGIRPLVGELVAEEMRARIAALAPHAVYYFVPPRSDEDPLQATLEAVSGPGLEAVVYAGSTAVYGDREGAWVDEEARPEPRGRTAVARLAAERRSLEAAREGRAPVRVCRITGIYGPGRTLRRALERGEYVLIRGHDTWVNRIHVDDLVGGLIAARERGQPGRVYNLVDRAPHRASEFACLAADLHGLERPRWVEKDEAIESLGEDRLRRKLDSKRVRSLRLREELGYELRYPTFRTGLPAAVAAEGG